MSARDAFVTGFLTEAVKLQTATVQAQPRDAAARLFLFELLTLAGRLRDARDQLLAVESDAEDWPITRRQFLSILQAQHRRERGQRPAFILDPQSHVKWRWNAARAVRDGRIDDAMGWIDRADEESPTIVGHVDGREFEDLRDTDDRFGSVLEVFYGNEFVWVPFELIQRITLAPAVGVLDVAFRSARLRLDNGQKLEVMLPLLYPGSHEADGVYATGQEADWPDCGGPVCGVGTRVWLLGEEEVVVGDCQQFEFRVG